MEERERREKSEEDAMTDQQKEDRDTLKDREWDDWKDMHEKGAGNKMH